MKPNVIELFPDGIASYEMPEKPNQDHSVFVWLEYHKAIEDAKRDRVYFKTGKYHEIYKALTGSYYDGMIKGKPYPILDSFHIEIKDGFAHLIPNNHE